MPIELINTLVASVLGVVIGAVANYFFTKKKMDAEIQKLEAETEKTRIESARLRADEHKTNLSEAEKPTNAAEDTLALQPLSTFWKTLLGAQPGKTIHVLLSAKQGFEWVQGKPTSKLGHTPLLSYNEVIGFQNLQVHLSQFSGKTALLHGGVEDLETGKVYLPEFPEDQTLIVIGSPNANKFSQRIFASPKIPKIPFRFGKNKAGKCVDVYQDETGQWSDTPLNSFPVATAQSGIDAEMEEDFGMILRVTNPRDAGNRNKVLILGGNHGLGTEAAVNFVLDDERVAALDALVQDQDFAAVFQASVSKRHGLGVGLRKVAVLKNGVWFPVKVS